LVFFYPYKMVVYYNVSVLWRSILVVTDPIILQKCKKLSYNDSIHTAKISITYLLTPRCRVLLEKLTGLQLVKKFPTFHGIWRFITALTSVRHLSLSWASPIQSIHPHPTSWRSILILSTHICLGLPSGLFPSGFPTKTLYTPLSSPIRAICPVHLRCLYWRNTFTHNTLWQMPEPSGWLSENVGHCSVFLQEMLLWEREREKREVAKEANIHYVGILSLSEWHTNDDIASQNI